MKCSSCEKEKKDLVDGLCIYCRLNMLELGLTQMIDDMDDLEQEMEERCKHS